MSSVAGIILAAGASSRLGSPKQLVQLGTETLLDRSVRIVLEAGLDPLFEVVPPDLWLGPSRPGTMRVINRSALEGMASSIRLGVQALTSHNAFTTGAVILACDQPAVTAAHLRVLASGGDEVVASAYAGRNGVPAYFPRAFFATLMDLRGDMGARELLRDSRAIVLPGGELDVDTIEDLNRARKLYST